MKPRFTAWVQSLAGAVLLSFLFGCPNPNSGVTDGKVLLNIDPPGIVYPELQTVTITSTPADATIMYTLDGSQPSRTHGYLYTWGSGGFIESSTGAVKAMGYRDGWTDSDVAQQDYTILWWIAASSGGGVYFSMDGGQSWWQQSAAGIGTVDRAGTDGLNEWVAFRDQQLPAIGTDVYSSTDRAVSWTHVSLNVSFLDLASDRSGTWVAAFLQGSVSSPGYGVKYSTHAGATWNDPASVPAGLADLSAVAGDGYRSWAAVGQSATAIYTGGWADGTWQAGTGLSGNLFDVATDGIGHWAAVGATTGLSGGGIQGRAFYSSDDGATWTAATLPPTVQLRAVASDGLGRFVAVGGGSGETPVVFYSHDSGQSWTAATHPLTSSTQELISVYCNGYGTCVAVGSNRTIIRSTDGGVTWSASSIAPSSGGSATDTLTSVTFGRWEH